MKLEACPLCDGVPLVVVLCCELIEARLEQDGTGIYRRNGNKPIVDQLEEEMNKTIETFTKDHELMKGFCSTILVDLDIVCIGVRNTIVLIVIRLSYS